MSRSQSDPRNGEASLAAVHARFARAVILIYLGAAAVGADGTTLWSEPQAFLKSGVSLQDAPWFQAALRTRGVMIVPVQPEREKDSVLFMVSPILRSGQFTGVLVGAIDLALEGALGTE